MTEIAEPFDRAARRRARDRAAPGFNGFAFLKDALCAELAARLASFGRRLECVLDLGAHDGRMRAHLPGSYIVACDAGCRFARAARGIMCDEDRLPFRPASFDAVVSAASLHGVNDLPGALAQVRRCLRPGGVFVAAFVGGASLQDIRARVIATEIDSRGGASPRFMPMVDPREAPSLLQRAGFVDPVVDVTLQRVRHADAGAMLRDVRGTGETNILAARSRTPLTRTDAARFSAAAEAVPDADGRHSATLEIVTLTARAPDR